MPKKRNNVPFFIFSIFFLSCIILHLTAFCPGSLTGGCPVLIPFRFADAWDLSHSLLPWNGFMLSGALLNNHSAFRGGIRSTYNKVNQQNTMCSTASRSGQRLQGALSLHFIKCRDCALKCEYFLQLFSVTSGIRILTFCTFI